MARRQTQFWIALNGNFIDMAVLEWCKLFGDPRAVHHWAKCVTDAPLFTDGLHNATGLAAPAFEAYRLSVRAYRDKYIAHLDTLNNFTVPDIQPIIDSSRYLYQYLVDVEDDLDALHDAPHNARTVYRENLRHARLEHASGNAT